MGQLFSKWRTDKTTRIRRHPHGAGETRPERRGEPVLELIIRDQSLMLETERLLAGRTRDIRLKGRFAEAFRQRIWRQTAKTIRCQTVILYGSRPEALLTRPIFMAFMLLHAFRHLPH